MSTDREKAYRLLHPGTFVDRVELVATALAEERAKARAPFEALANELVDRNQGWADYVADRIRLLLDGAS